MEPDIHEQTIELQSSICQLVADFERTTGMRVETIIPNRGLTPAPFGSPALWGMNITISPLNK